MAADAARPGRWALLLMVLAAFLFVPATPLVQAVVPLRDTSWMIVVTLAICTVVGWGVGGRGWLAVMWVALAVAVLSVTPVVRPAYASLERGWSVLLAGAFGLACETSPPTTRFFPRALTALALSIAIAGLLAATTPGGLRATTDAARTDAESRPNAALVWMRESEQSPDWQQWRSVNAGSSLDDAVQTADSVLTTLPHDAVPFFPALLALESLGALALCWGLYHRISRTRLGEQLAPLRDFTFSDHLVWGLIAGIVLFVLPVPDAWRGTGANLLVFFGVLYAVRGLAVLAWYLEASRAGAPVIAALVVVAMVLSAPAVLGLGLLGLGDTWMDWRHRPGGATPRPTT